MKNIGFAAFTPHGFVGFRRHFKGVPDMLLVACLELGFQGTQEGTVLPQDQSLLLILRQIIGRYGGYSFHLNEYSQFSPWAKGD